MWTNHARTLDYVATPGKMLQHFRSTPMPAAPELADTKNGPALLGLTFFVDPEA
jgi:hypothetical protein